MQTLLDLSTRLLPPLADMAVKASAVLLVAAAASVGQSARRPTGEDRTRPPARPGTGCPGRRTGGDPPRRPDRTARSTGCGHSRTRCTPRPAAGSRPADYAEHILAIASGLRSPLLAAHSAIAMARPSRLEGRLLAILDRTRKRRRLTLAAIFAAAILAGGVILPLSIISARTPERPMADNTVVGRLVDAASKPVAGAEVFVATPSRQLSLFDLKSGIPEVVRMKTVSDGRFWVPPQGGPFAVFVIDERGCAEATEEELRKSPTLTLAAWGKVAGKLQLTGTAPGGADIVLTGQRRRLPGIRMFYVLRTRADAEGRFQFDRVPPGKWAVARQVKIEKLQAGVTMCDHGELVDGRIAGPGRRKTDWDRLVVYGTVRRIEPPQSPPPIPAGLTDPKERASWMAKWAETDEGKAYLREWGSSPSGFDTPLAVLVDRDGAFRVEDVPAGKYKLQIAAHDRPGEAKRICSVSREFTVPQMPGGRSEEALDLGVLKMTAPGAAPAPTSRPGENGRGD